MTHDTPQLTISLQEPHRVILEVQQGGKVWEIDVRIDTDEDGGIIAEIGRDFCALHIMRIWLDGKALQRAAGLKPQQGAALSRLPFLLQLTKFKGVSKLALPLERRVSWRAGHLNCA